MTGDAQCGPGGCAGSCRGRDDGAHGSPSRLRSQAGRCQGMFPTIISTVVRGCTLTSILCSNKAKIEPCWHELQCLVAQAANEALEAKAVADAEAASLAMEAAADAAAAELEAQKRLLQASCWHRCAACRLTSSKLLISIVELRPCARILAQESERARNELALKVAQAAGAIRASEELKEEKCGCTRMLYCSRT